MAAKKSAGKNRVFLILTGGMLVTALTVCAILLLGNAGAADETQRVIELGTALRGVSVGGVDISGMTKGEALAATAALPQRLLDQVSFTVDVSGESKVLTAGDLALATDYEQAVAKAMAYGRTGSFDERLAAANAAKDTGADFPVNVVADEAQLAAALTALKTRLDTEPLEAFMAFTPNGHFADGTAYDPLTYDKAAKGEPQLVMLAEDERPNRLRYEYYNDTRFEKEDNIPKDAYISRFYYTSEQTGIDVDLADLAAQISAALQSGDYAPITAKVTVTEPSTTVAMLKSQTQLVSSWTSSYSEHDSGPRVKNVTKLSGIINGQVLQPGVEWSINETAGDRTVARGWAEADGISDGGYTKQPGGGVCQISSTLFNAAIRSGLFYNDHTSTTAGENGYKWGIEVTFWQHHSIISGYIPLGLDATISTGGPDLKLLNHCTTSFYIVSYMDTKKECVTIEIYGQTVVHPQYGDVILSYTFDDLGVSGTATRSIYYNQTQTPDGKPIPWNGSADFGVSQNGRKVQTYRHYYSAADGAAVGDEKFEYHYYRTINPGTYCHYPETGPVVTPAPEVSSAPVIP
jgi:Uncharacterized vancomycin resistance protein